MHKPLPSLFKKILVLGTAAFATAASPLPLEGVFQSPDAKKSIRITCKADVCQGTIVASLDPKVAVGQVPLQNLRPQKGAWDGEVVAPTDGKRLPLHLVVLDKNTLRLTVKSGWMEKSRDWKRVP